ncbi:hypothetical protein [Paractinoplanes brasiliensis]|uniref:Uncharacterized protein n=1 Tax=Paractinoplanes brasiliensis TaxID=52695 RepID=A0A4R6J6H0_9ACTN|nr:hypothetical protein [Actinoplanes brasiliensis]TDO31070.1 hypothetical protein C8E87_6480 [Actinoplanes brasiliensis]
MRYEVYRSRETPRTEDVHPATAAPPEERAAGATSADLSWLDLRDAFSSRRRTQASPSTDALSRPVQPSREGASATGWAALRRTVAQLSRQTTGQRLKHVNAAIKALRTNIEQDDGDGEPGESVRVVRAAQRVATAVADAERRGPATPAALEGLVARVGELAGLLELEPPAELPPMFLDVAAPGHGELVVRERRTHFGPGHVSTTDSDVVVQANDCHLDAVDHYHVRRVTLDCKSLYRDPLAVERFADVMADPSDRAVGALKDRLRHLAGPPREDGVQAYRREISPYVSVDSHRSKLVNQGDGAKLRVRAHYHVRETVIPLAEMLNERPELIGELAAAFRGGPHASDPAATMLTAVGDLETRDLLAGAPDLGHRNTSVTHSFRGASVDLASAVMVGYGNTISRRSEIDLATRLGGSLKKLDVALARAVSTHPLAPVTSPTEQNPAIPTPSNPGTRAPAPRSPQGLASSTPGTPRTTRDPWTSEDPPAPVPIATPPRPISPAAPAPPPTEPAEQDKEFWPYFTI